MHRFPDKTAASVDSARWDTEFLSRRMHKRIVRHIDTNISIFRAWKLTECGEIIIHWETEKIFCCFAVTCCIHLHIIIASRMGTTAIIQRNTSSPAMFRRKSLLPSSGQNYSPGWNNGSYTARTIYSCFDINASSEIRTQDPSIRAEEASSRLSYLSSH
jgi:hypothetical protein